jgi:23S rRNA (adenine2503-C2)-methyltransferase
MNSKITDIISKDDILANPYNYTYKEMIGAMGEEDAASFFRKLYSGRANQKNSTVKIKDKYKGGDTIKYVFEMSDGYSVETVCIKRKTGTTVCVSTMVGCPVGCIFCASGSNGFIRNLSVSEIVQQIVFLNERINRIVFMGMGEPLFNYETLIKAIHILRDRNGMNFPTDGITISTVGPIDQLKKLREEHLKIQLTLSLHATNQKTRDKLLPHMRKYNIDDVVEAILSYSERHNKKVTIAYLLIPGLNDKYSDVRQLKKWFKGKKVLINLLQYNETSCCDLKRPNKQQLVAFRDRLQEAGLEVIIRESRGNNIKAACGQLVSKKNKRQELQ